MKAWFTCEWVAAGSKGGQKQQRWCTIHDSSSSSCRRRSLHALSASHEGRREFIDPALAEGKKVKKKKIGTQNWNERTISVASFYSYLCLSAHLDNSRPPESHHRRYRRVDNVYQPRRKSFLFDNPLKK